MSLTPGTRVGPYEVQAPLGAGGMGEVYRARDTRLDRDAALKILPDAFSTHPDRLARFEREAKVLASLNHPHIAQVYGLEECFDERGRPARAIAMELVEGDTLADRLARGALPLDDALPIARQIAEALEAAHEKGVIHRDLKPANVKVTPAGTVKVLDFGLAKMADAGSGGPDIGSGLSQSPTVATPAMTEMGLVLGTPGYMAPEQARGKVVDHRADIWAFGCLLYEMLAGRPVFPPGETISDAVAAVLTREPDWAALPSGVPGHVRRVLRRCLERDRDRRLHHIADARIELDDASQDPHDGRLVQRDRRSVGLWGLLPWAVAALALATTAWTLWSGPAPTAVAPPVRRLELNLPEGVELFAVTTRSVAVSSDGSRLAFVGVRTGSRQVYLRPLDKFEATPVRGSEGATTCFFSPDGGSLGFVTSAGVLRVIALTDGLVTTVTDKVNFLFGAAWSANGSIVFVRSGALWQVPAVGGTPTPLTMLGGPRNDTLHAWPQPLPDGRTVLFSPASGDQSRIESLVLATGERKVVVEQGTRPLYAASGHLLFLRDGTLMAAPFDSARLDVTGPAVQALDGPTAARPGGAVVEVSPTGTMVYEPITAASRLVWVSRQGAEAPLNDAPRGYHTPRFSPDGSRVVVQVGDLWVQDLARSTFTRLTNQSQDTAINSFPTWTRDGGQIMARTARGLQLLNADGSGEARIVPGTAEFDYPGAFTPDGKTVLFLRSSQESSFDIYTVPLDDPSRLQPLVNTPAYEGGVQLSPDGRWLIYVSNTSGENEIYLRPFPGPDRRWQVSANGGMQPTWGPSGREIFYRNGDKMMVVEVSTSPDVTLSPPRLLFERRYAFGNGITIANYDVSRDGQRFVMVKDESGAGRLHVVLNWFSDLEKLAPRP